MLCVLVSARYSFFFSKLVSRVWIEKKNLDIDQKVEIHKAKEGCVQGQHPPKG
jgi:hypothetical protein